MDTPLNNKWIVLCYAANLMNLFKEVVVSQPQIIVDQPKRKRRCEERCSQHQFSIRSYLPVRKNLNVTVKMCPKYQRGNNPSENMYPEFNHDRLYYTSTFILGADRKDLQSIQKDQYLEHIRSTRVFCQKNCKVMFPKPNQKHTTCAVCKQEYENYYSHILSKSHKERIASSVYNVEIELLTQHFQSLHPQNKSSLSSPFLTHNERKIQSAETSESDYFHIDKKQPDTKDTRDSKTAEVVVPKKRGRPFGSKSKQNTVELEKKARAQDSVIMERKSSSSSSSTDKKSRGSSSSLVSRHTRSSRTSTSSSSSTPILQYMKKLVKKGVPVNEYKQAKRQHQEDARLIYKESKQKQEETVVPKTNISPVSKFKYKTKNFVKPHLPSCNPAQRQQLKEISSRAQQQPQQPASITPQQQVKAAVDKAAIISRIKQRLQNIKANPAENINKHLETIPTNYPQSCLDSRSQSQEVKPQHEQSLSEQEQTDKVQFIMGTSSSSQDSETGLVIPSRLLQQQQCPKRKIFVPNNRLHHEYSVKSVRPAPAYAIRTPNPYGLPRKTIPEQSQSDTPDTSHQYPHFYS